MEKIRQFRPGVSLIELLLFIGFFALCSGVVVAVLFFSNEQYIRQRIVVDVEQEGMQLMQAITRRIRRAENILVPLLNTSGSVVVLQMANQDQNPTIFAIQSGAIIVAEHDAVRALSSGKFPVTGMYFYNTSASEERLSLLVKFEATREIPLPVGSMYTRTFETLVTLFPDDYPTGNECGCNPPMCQGGVLSWEVCDSDTCSPASQTLPCT